MRARRAADGVDGVAAAAARFASLRDSGRAVTAPNGAFLSGLTRHRIIELLRGDGQKVEDVEPQVMDVVRGHFRPEFLNRLDEIILFHRLAQEHMAPIVDIQVARVQKLLKDRKIVLDLTEAAKKWLGRVGYDPVYGARPLKRAVQRYVQDPLADMILAGNVPDGSTVRIEEGDGELAMTVS